MHFVLDSYKIKNKGVFFDGVSVQFNEMITRDNFDPEKHIKLLKEDPTGEFVLIEWEGENLRVQTDILGYYSIFYVVFGDRLLVSNSFRALSDYYKKNIAGFLTLNINFIIPLLLSNNNFFHTPYLNETSAEEILLLPTNKYLIKNSEHIKLKPISSIINLQEDTYTELIEKGVNNVLKKINYLNDLYDENLKILYLSGGKDSRVVLSFIQASNVKKNLYVFSQDPERFQGNNKEIIKKDLVVANKLCTLFSYKKISRLEIANLSKKEIQLSLDESIQNYFNFYSNIKYRFQPSYNKVLKMEPHIEFQGLSGELYRPYWSPYYRRFSSFNARIMNTWKSIGRDLQNFYLTFVQTKIIAKDVYEDARRYFMLKMSEIEKGKGIYKKIDTHYNLFRNRFHFGGNLYSYNIGKYRFSPLIDIHFLFAAKKLSVEDQESGKLIFDLIDQLNPYLNLIPFDTDETWEKERHVSGKIKNSINNILRLPSLTEDGLSKLGRIDCIKERPKEASFFATTQFLNNEFSNIDIEITLNSYFEKMLSFLSKNDAFFNPELIDYVRQIYNKGGASKNIIFGKLVAISDVYSEKYDIEYFVIR